MKLSVAIDNLFKHNKWRRDNLSKTQPINPTDLGLSIDIVTKYFKSQKTFFTLKRNIEQWAIDRGIDKSDSFVPQMKKILEEQRELTEELKNGNIKNAKVELGDLFVTIIILAQQEGFDIEECLSLAYDKIKDRKGKKINGVFVKESDL